MTYRTSLLAVLVAAASTPAVVAHAGGGAAAAGKAKPKVKACGIYAIPLQIGNQWVYGPVEYPWPLDKDGNPIKVTPDQMKLMPVQPQKVTITVADVQVAKDVTTVSLTEDVDGVVTDTTLTCTKDSLVASPDSFWFAGEPGGSQNLQLTITERKGSTFAIQNGAIGAAGNTWNDDLKATWKRTPTEGTTADLGSGTIELDRRWVLQDDESVATTANNFANVHKVGLEMKGHITIDGADADSKPADIPDLVSFF